MVTIQQQAKEGVQWMADTIEQLQKERDYLDARCAELEQERRWIPVSERLPIEDVYVQVTDGFGDVFQAKLYLKYGKPKWVWQGYDVDIVTHWQPLPQPPTDKDGE